MAFVCVSTSSKSLTGPQNQPAPSGPDVNPPTPPPSPTTVVVTPTIDLVTLYRNPGIGYQVSDTIGSNTASIFNPRNYPFGVMFLHYDWIYLENTQGVYTFNGEVNAAANILKDLDNAWANGMVANVKILELDASAGIDGPAYLSAIAGWTASDGGSGTWHFADYSNAAVRTALGNFLQALYAAIGTHPAFGWIDAGWGRFQENTYSDTAIISKINTTLGTIGSEIPSLDATTAVNYYDVWSTYIPANKQLTFVEDQTSWDYAAGTKHTGGRTDSFGYQAPITVQCTTSATTATYGGQFMCRKNPQTFAANQTVITPYTPSQPLSYLNAPMAGEIWSFFFRTFGTGGSSGVVTADAGTEQIIVTYSSGTPFTLVNGNVVRLYSIGGAVPAPLVEGDDYFVIGYTLASPTVFTIQLSLTSGGAAINLTSAGTGTLHMVGSTGVNATGTYSSRRWEGADWDFASSFQFGIDNHFSFFNVKNGFRTKKSWLTAVDNLLRSAGYRYQLRSFSFPNLATAGNTVTFASNWRNVGNAPNYRITLIGYRLRNVSTNVMTYLTNNRQLNFNAFSVVGDTSVSDVVTIPNYLDDGSYEISVGGMNSLTNVGEIKFAITSPADDGSRWYPMGTISIASPFTISPSPPATYSAHFTGTATKYGELSNRESFHLSHNIRHVFLSSTVQTDFAIFMRVKQQSIAVTQALFVKGDVGSAANFEWGVYYSNSFSGFNVGVSDGTNVQRVTWTSNATVGQWYNVYMEYDSTTRIASLSVDNAAQVDATALAADVTITTQKVRMGADTSTTKRPATADIKYVYTWKKKLSAAARLRLDNSGAGIPLSDFNDELKDQLYSAYNFQGLSLADSWNINHFTNVGGVSFV